MLSKSKNIQAEYIYHVSVFCRKWRFYRSFKSFFSHLTTNKIQPNLVENSKIKSKPKEYLRSQIRFFKLRFRHKPNKYLKPRNPYIDNDNLNQFESKENKLM